MGTVTAIADFHPYNHWPTATTATAFTIWQPSVDFEDWETAVDFAARLALAVGKVKIRKDGPTWVVSWNATQSTTPQTYPIYPQPYQPYQPYPSWWTSGGSQA